MLLFQTDFGHIEKRCRGRFEEEPRWLVGIVAEINQYLPDDWRMTRSQNNFRVQVVSKVGCPALVGCGFRAGSDETVYLIDTLYHRDWPDSVDLRNAAEQGKPAATPRGRVLDPSCVRPNLYFFEPCPDDSPSPLYARQYEKIDPHWKPGRVAVEYHRVHPLTKSGVDPDHFRWVRWTSDGEVQMVSAPDPQFRGKSFKAISELRCVKTRVSDVRVYKDMYKNVLSRAGVHPPATRVPKKHYEREFKFLFYGSAEDFEAMGDLVCDLAKEKRGMTVKKGTTQTQVDAYYDDASLSLQQAGASFRVRQKPDNTLITLKKRLPDSREVSGSGLYERIEEEATISGAQASALDRGEEITAFPYRLISYVAPACGALRETVRVQNLRTLSTFTVTSKLEHVECCLDRVNYEVDGNQYGPFYEIELESKGVDDQLMLSLAQDIEENLPVIPSLQSKYERGIFLLKQNSQRRSSGPKRIIIDTDCGVDDALALIVAFRSPEVKVEAITTVAGNVSLDKVTPNVFKVMEALGIKDNPPVAEGAAAPVTPGKQIEAESVHGTDGLGDVARIPAPHVVLDKRKAWDLICDLACQYPKEITLITVGPLTNLAIAMRKRPQDVEKLGEIVAMGGVFFEVGNVAPDAEFNVAADPEAAREVMEFCRERCRKTAVDANGNRIAIHPGMSKEERCTIDRYEDRASISPSCLPLTFVGLDVTQKVILRESLLDNLQKRHPNNALLRFVGDIAAKYVAFHKENEGVKGCYLHDPLAVAYAVNPAFLEVNRYILRVETSGTLTNGVIFPDDRPTTDPRFRNPEEEVIGVARRIEKEAFEEFMLNILLK